MTIAHIESVGPAVHHDPPEVVAQRQLLGVWLLIAGDAVIVGSLLFTYLYLRGLNTQKQWMPAGVHGASLVLSWGLVAVTALSALAVWSGEQSIRRGKKDAVSMALVAAVLALAASAIGVAQLAQIPHALNSTSGVRQIAGSYASSLLALDMSNLAHLVLLAFLGLAVAVRVGRGATSAQAWTHARFVRIFWVWVASAIGASAVVTTLFVNSPH